MSLIHPRLASVGAEIFIKFWFLAQKEFVQKKANQELSSIPSLYIYTVYIRSVIEFLE